MQMRSIANVKIEGLFGYVDHDVKFTSNSPITIISGPNGIGKTHFLRILNGLITLDLRVLASVEFKLIEVRFTDGWILGLRQVSQTQRSTEFQLYGRKAPARKFQRLTIRHQETDETPEDVPEFFIRLPSGDWYDTRLDRVLPPDQAKRWRLPITLNALRQVEGTWAEELYGEAQAILVDTQRLDALPAYSKSSQRANSPSPTRASTTKIRLYIGQVAAQVSEARRQSLDESLDADQTFAARALKKARTTINEKGLKERYQRIADQHAELHASGMSVRPVDVRFPEERTNPTEKRILNVFLDDWERKLKPLLPMHEKLKSLRRIVETKFVGKELYLSDRGQIRFRSKVNSRPVNVHSLSSGEQHLLALFTMLLFSANRGSLVLIDEPEISMHAAWKHAFLDDIEEVARISNLQIVIATHSSAIINGNWHLVQEIEAPEIGDDPAGALEDDDVDDFDAEV
ncbi:AAA family ATPase [Streptomyces sp. NPDC059072]|uniref:AAA family ATPase n=1 Tax=Streptomyces sp. NPDC059072 TaxID=3346715 RepID=UPI0036770F5E